MAISRDKPTAFTVAGRGTFPLDMLRHDHCWPRDSDDAVSIAANPLYREIRLTAQHERIITPGRWRSFGWTVIAIDSDPLYRPEF